MTEPFWAAAGPSRPTSSSFVSVPAPTPIKKKRGRFSGENRHNATSLIPSIVNPPSPELVPRHSSSASSWGIEDLSDSDGDYDWPTASLSSTAPAYPSMPPNTSPDLDRDELARLARPSKRVHLETPEDQQTYGKLAGLRIDPNTLAASVPSETSFGRPQNYRSNSGVAGAFGLSASLASAFGANPDSLAFAPRVPPSSPTKTDATPSSFGGSASNLYQQAVAPVPPTSPSVADRAIAPPSSPLQAYGFPNKAALPIERSSSAELEDSDMRQRRGVPSSYEVEPDRIVVTSLDDTSSSEGDASSEVGGQKTPEADTSTDSKDSSNEFVINNELMEKLEAHSRAVLTGTSDRDNAASTSRSSASSGSGSRSRRSGRRSTGSAVPSLGSLLSSRRRSAQSSPGSSGYASPINAEEARGALILWKDPEEVLKSTSASTSSPLKQSGLASVPENGAAAASLMEQSPVSFQSGSALPRHSTSNTGPFSSSHMSSFSEIPGMTSLPLLSQAAESPLYAQQSSLSSSYFPEPSALDARFSNQMAQPVQFGGTSTHQAMAPRSHHDNIAFGQAQPASTAFSTGITIPQHHYGHHYSSNPQPAATGHDSHGGTAHVAQHAHTAGAQPIDLSGCFGPAEGMDLDD
ncbi:hypothetical protein PHSY_000595 [Pseudozyma hubeiensis SY62]|uniref:Uncharacterized protein n=1 Tax=Pseudozyma hubeiensis (strain SY62) TaxID=1305764 RepID=R9NWV2_PSEHS|nr:hypothetical protein PHSY_000595 [Pseudozyma hubeiensis SY62]GAC93034.1 hypothetical protein PHSY_000595 [Pseudozyma hubeiensis SY62]